MAISASTTLDLIWGLVLNVFEGLLALLAWANTNQTDIIGGIIVLVTISVVVVFGGKIGKFLSGLFDRVLRMLP